MPGPPTNAVRPSITTILRWSKWLRSSKRQSGRRSPEEAVEVEERALVGRHLDAAVDERPVERLGAAVGLAVASLHQQPDRDALGDLADEQVAQLAADHAVLEAEDQDVDVARRGLDVGEQAREERRAVDEDVPGGRGARGEVDRERQAPPALSEDRLDEGAGLLCADRLGRRGLERAAPLAAPPRQRAAGRRRAPRDEHPPAHASSLPFRSVGWVGDLARVPVPAAATAASGPDGITDAPAHAGARHPCSRPPG